MGSNSPALLGALAFSLSASLASAQELASGTMKNDAATSGKTNITTETFDAGKKADDSKDVTEAKIVAGGLWATGNSRSLATTALGTVRSRSGANEVSAAAAVNYGRSATNPDEDMTTTVENYQGKLRYDRFVSEKLSLFLSLSGRKDRFQGLTLRLNLDPGFAYYFIDGKKEQLWGELGYDLQFDIRRNSAIRDAAEDGITLEKSDTRHSARAFAGYRNNLNEHVQFNTGLEYLQGIPDTEYWRLNWDVGLSAAIASRFSLATTFALRYDNHPLPNIKKLDTVTAVNLVYTLL